MRSHSDEKWKELHFMNKSLTSKFALLSIAVLVSSCSSGSSEEVASTSSSPNATILNSFSDGEIITNGDQSSTTTESIAKADPKMSCEKRGSCSIGDVGPGGGTIFYKDSEKNYYEAACKGWAKNCDGSDDPTASWSCSNRGIPGADGEEVGDGLQNTSDISAADKCPGNAANLAANYEVDGLSDWFLPSISELALMYENIKQMSKDNPFFPRYWSSTEYSGLAGIVSFYVQDNGSQNSTFKDYQGAVRPIRKFSINNASPEAMDSPNSASETATSPITTLVDTTSSMPSKYFQGSFEVVDELGWKYKVTVPKISNVNFSLTKDESETPPGNAKFKINVGFGNTGDITIQPDSSNKAAPKVEVYDRYISLIPIKRTSGSWLSDNGTGILNSDKCHLESTDGNPATLEVNGQTTSGSQHISGVFCSRYYAGQVKTYSASNTYGTKSETRDSGLVQETLNGLEGSSTGFILILSNSCNLYFEVNSQISVHPQVPGTYYFWLTTEGATSTCTVGNIVPS